MKKETCKAVAMLALVVFFLAAGLCQQAQAAASFPTKTVTLVAHTAPGGGGDVFCRPVAKVLQEMWGKPVVVDNRPGGSGAVSLQLVSDSRPDGHTLLALTNTHLITALRSNIPKTVSDLQPVSRLLLEGVLLYVKQESKWTAESFLEALFKGTANVKIGSSQAGTPDSMAIETLAKKYKGKINMVVYPDSNKAIVGVLGGDVDAATSEISEIKPQLDAKKLKVLLTFNSKRIPAFPNVPTFVEKGYPEVVIDKFRGFAVPKNTPPEAVKALEEAFQKVLNNADYKKTLANAEQIPAYQNAADFQKFITDTDNFYKAFLTAEKK
jgi:tripartite-type tricarboxylate transporter receptor subunit TctC